MPRLFYPILKSKYVNFTHLLSTAGSTSTSQLTDDRSQRTVTLVLDHMALSNKTHCVYQYESVRWDARVSGHSISWLPRLRDVLKFLFPQKRPFFLSYHNLSVWLSKKGTVLHAQKQRFYQCLATLAAEMSSGKTHGYTIMGQRVMHSLPTKSLRDTWWSQIKDPYIKVKN